MFSGVGDENVEKFITPRHLLLNVASFPCIMAFLDKRDYCVTDRPYSFMRDYRVIGNVTDKTSVMTSLLLYDSYLDKRDYCVTAWSLCG